MQEVLSFKRLINVLGKNWYEYRKPYLLFFLSVTIFMAGWFIFSLVVFRNQMHMSPGDQAAIYFMGLYVSGCLSASFLFQDFSSKARAFNFLSLPASALEKLCCILFYGVLIFFIVYTAIYFLTDWVAVKIAGNLYSPEWQQSHGITQPYFRFNVASPFSLNADRSIFYAGDNFDLLAAFFPIQACFVLGALYFSKNSIVKTVIILFLLLFLFLTLETRVLFPSMPWGTTSVKSFSAYIIPGADGNELIVAHPSWIRNVVIFAARFLIAPAIWLACYFRIKEKQI
jgi:hypothetical protein